MGDKKIEASEEIRNLKKQIAMYQELIDHTLHGVYIIDTEGKIIWINKVSELIDGVKLKDIIGKKDNEVWHDKEQNIDVSLSTILKTQKTGKPSGEQFFTFTDRSGKDVPMFIESFPFYYENQFEYVYSIGYYIDYSEKQLNKIAEYRQHFFDENIRTLNNTKYTLYDIVGAETNFVTTIYMAEKVAKRDAPIMICGETGTGKELFAQGIHNASGHSKGKFVAINCAAIPDNLIESYLFGTVKGAYTGALDKAGLIEEADGGSLFLDELNSLPINVQGKLLRVLQERQACRIGDTKTYRVNCRFISATNQNPRDLVREKSLRSDLYYRLSVVVLDIPPLRERKSDIPLLIKHFVTRSNTQYHTSIKKADSQVLSIFESYSWPGNVRELEHVIEYMMNFVTMTQETLTIQELPSYLRPATASFQLKLDQKIIHPGTLNQMVDEFKQEIIEKTLKTNEWNITKSAKDLGMSRENLYHFIKRLNISKPS